MNTEPFDAPMFFGPFRLSAGKRLLEKDGERVALGGRALDILIALAADAGQVVGKRELMARVWSDVTVEEGSLRFHMVALRKALGSDETGSAYVSNIPGRGYRLAATVTRSPVSEPTSSTGTPTDTAQRLPAPTGRMVGRDETVRELATELALRRFVSIVGPGGIGKTTVALAVARALSPDFSGAVHFVDLGPINDPVLVLGTVAATLGLRLNSGDGLSKLTALLRDKRFLIVLDSCEHLIDAATELAEHISRNAPQAHILVTSQEPLRATGEYVHRLPSLGCPPENGDLDAAQLLAFPAVQLFVERAAVSGRRFEFDDADSPAIADICRKLDGIALAIELVAGRVEAYGVSGIAALLEKRFALLWHGRRTALPRHRTLYATIEWSHKLLPEFEQVVARRLAVFVGTFTLEAGHSVAGSDESDTARTIEAIANLAAKSLLAVDAGSGKARYRLLDTTRMYMLERLGESGEEDAIARRHASYFCRLAASVPGSSMTAAREVAPALHRDDIANMRVALEWSFSPRGDAEVATSLAAAAAPRFLDMSLLAECRNWAQRAIAALAQSTRGSRRELDLQTALGQSLMFTTGNVEDVANALSAGLALAERLGDSAYELRLVSGLHMYLHRIADFRGALALAHRGRTVARRLTSACALATAESMLGVSQHMMGNYAVSKAHWDAALNRTTSSKRADTVGFGFDHRIRALCGVARNLWLQGFPEQAVEAARLTIEEATALEHPVTSCIARIWTVPVYFWTGDLSGAEAIVERLIVDADKYSLAPFAAAGEGLRGEICLLRGDPSTAVKLLRKSLAAMHVERYEMLNTGFSGTLAQSLAMAGRLDEALTTIDDAIAGIERNGDLIGMPEMLRIKGDTEVLASNPDAAHESFMASLEWSRKQAAVSWELRAATSLAGLWQRQEKHSEAHRLLAPLVARFHEGLGTSDLIAARTLLTSLSDSAVT